MMPVSHLNSAKESVSTEWKWNVKKIMWKMRNNTLRWRKSLGKWNLGSGEDIIYWFGSQKRLQKHKKYSNKKNLKCRRVYRSDHGFTGKWTNPAICRIRHFTHRSLQRRRFSLEIDSKNTQIMSALLGFFLSGMFWQKRI